MITSTPSITAESLHWFFVQEAISLVNMSCPKAVLLPSSALPMLMVVKLATQATIAGLDEAGAVVVAAGTPVGEQPLTGVQISPSATPPVIVQAWQLVVHTRGALVTGLSIETPVLGNVV